MAGEKNSLKDPQFRKRWVDYLSNLETIRVLEKALETARASGQDQLAEVLDLLLGPNELIHGPAGKEKKLFHPSKPVPPTLP